MRFHSLESSASPPVRTFIEETAPEVWEELSRPGMGGPENCLASVGVWVRHLHSAGIPHERLGRHLIIGQGEVGGYRLDTGEVVDRQFLAVGNELALFDPTAGSGHIRHTAATPLDRYVVADGTTFPEWRNRRLGLK